MKNHDCVFSKYCDNYIADSCQGCGNVGKNDQTYISNELSWFGIEEHERKNTMIFTETEKKSYRDHCLPYSSKKTDYTKYSYNTNKIKDVIFSPPATIVLWNDGTKTVVKAGERDIYDPEKGLVMAIAKKFFGNKGNYYNNVRKFVEPYEKKQVEKIAALNYVVSKTNPWTKDGDPTCQE